MFIGGCGCPCLHAVHIWPVITYLKFCDTVLISLTIEAIGQRDVYVPDGMPADQLITGQVLEDIGLCHIL